MKFHKGSKNEGNDERLFTLSESVVAFIVQLNTLPAAATCKGTSPSCVFDLAPALDECAQLTGCNCFAEWPFPVPHP